jgi:L-malate glycosyltransferase
MSIKVLCLTDHGCTPHSARPETETFLGVKKLGIDIELMLPLNAPHLQQFKDADIPITELVIRKRFDFNAIKKIRKTIITHNIDIIHTFNNRTAINGLLACIGLNTKIIMYRGIVANVSFLNPSSWLSYLNPKVSKVVCVANAIRDYFWKMSFLGLGLNKSKFMTIYKGHNLDWYNETPADLKQFNIPEDAFVVGCIANSRPRKGLEYLIRAAGDISEHLNIHFLLIGDMSADYLVQAVESNPNKKQIHLVGHRSDATALIAACNISVLPSLRREGLPKSVIESMVYGVPAIVTDSGGSPELIENKINGLIIPSGNSESISESIMYMFENRNETLSMGSKARQRIENNFNIQQTIQQTYDLYCEIAHTKH